MEKGDEGFGDVSALFGPCIVYALRFAAGAVYKAGNTTLSLVED
jgi:hypothetical protein